MQIDKHFLTHLMDEVVLPFHRYMDTLDATKRDLDSNEKVLKHKLDTAILAVALVQYPLYVKEKLQKSSVAHNDLDISYKEMHDGLNVFFKLMADFLAKKGKSKEFQEQLESYGEFFMGVYKPKKDQESKSQENEEDFFDDGDDFFDFDSEDIDKEIDKMHFEEHEKISAHEFMQSDSFGADNIADIADIIEAFQDQSSNFDHVDAHYIEEFEVIVSRFETIFTLSYEFRNIGYALNTLYAKILAYDTTHLKEEQKELLKLLLDSIITDLAKFHSEVLAEQTAVDIHYLDASLLANIAQIEIILDQIKGE